MSALSLMAIDTDEVSGMKGKKGIKRVFMKGNDCIMPGIDTKVQSNWNSMNFTEKSTN